MNSNWPFVNSEECRQNATESFLAGYSAAHKWVEVKERMPESNTIVLVFNEIDAKLDIIGRWIFDGQQTQWIDMDGYPIEITHWFPLPPFPTTK